MRPLHQIRYRVFQLDGQSGWHVEITDLSKSTPPAAITWAELDAALADGGWASLKPLVDRLSRAGLPPSPSLLACVHATALRYSAALKAAEVTR